jgi:hypothetical protein
MLSNDCEILLSGSNSRNHSPGKNQDGIRIDIEENSHSYGK